MSTFLDRVAPHNGLHGYFLRILVHLVIYDSGQVSLEHLLLSWYPTESVNSMIQLWCKFRCQWTVMRVIFVTVPRRARIHGA